LSKLSRIRRIFEQTSLALIAKSRILALAAIKAIINSKKD
jgi:hypothetical protein